MHNRSSHIIAKRSLINHLLWTHSPLAGRCHGQSCPHLTLEIPSPRASARNNSLLWNFLGSSPSAARCYFLILMLVGGVYFVWVCPQNSFPTYTIHCLLSSRSSLPTAQRLAHSCWRKLSANNLFTVAHDLPLFPSFLQLNSLLSLQFSISGAYERQ